MKHHLHTWNDYNKENKLCCSTCGILRNEKSVKMSMLDNCKDCTEGSYRKCDECLRNMVKRLEIQLDEKKCTEN